MYTIQTSLKKVAKLVSKVNLSITIMNKMYTFQTSLN